MRHSPALTATALGMALAGCGGNESAAPAPTPSPSAAATVSATPTASIIRPDVVQSPVIDLPPAPLAATVGFPEGGARLDDAARTDLDRILTSEQLGEGWPVVLRGHSDSVGGDDENLRASRHRAQAVADYLEAHGVAEDRITVIALGEQNPVAPNALPDGSPNDEGRAKNRRVEIEIAPPEAPAPDVTPESEEAETKARETEGT